MELTPDLEQRRTVGGVTGARWFEGHRLDLFVESSEGAGPAAVMLSIVAEPAVARVSFVGVVLRAGFAPVVVADDDVPLPDRGWEVRTSGLWADHVCETPLEHWSYGLEAFGLSLDDPEALLGRGFGERTPIGWELEFEAASTAQWSSTPLSTTPWSTAEEYRQLGVGHGLVLDGDGQHAVEGVAIRTHWWGSRSPGRLEVGDVPPSGSDEPLSWVSVPSREARRCYALWGAGASSSPIDS